MRLTDEELVFRSLDGDTEAFAALVKRYQHAVYATAFHYDGRYGGAEDISQEAFWAAYRSLPRIREPEHFGAWLKGITTAGRRQLAAPEMRRACAMKRPFLGAAPCSRRIFRANSPVGSCTEMCMKRFFGRWTRSRNSTSCRWCSGMCRK